MLAIFIAVVALVSGAKAFDNAGNSSAVTMAVADPSRPDSDTARDADRRPAQTLVFAGIDRGTRLPTMSPTLAIARVLRQRRRLQRSRLRGGAHRLLQVPAFRQGSRATCRAMRSPIRNLDGDDCSGARRTRSPRARPVLDFPDYHDLHDEFMGPVDTAAFNKAVYSALKPGGVYVILDHSAASRCPRQCNRDLASHRVLDCAPRGRSRGIQVRLREFDSRQSSRTLARPKCSTRASFADTPTSSS